MNTAYLLLDTEPALRITNPKLSAPCGQNSLLVQLAFGK